MGQEFFIIEEGEIECLKSNDDQTLEFIRNLTKGEHFGELALINNEPRSLNIRAKTDTSLLMLNREAFKRILGDIEKHLKKDYTK